MSSLPGRRRGTTETGDEHTGTICASAPGRIRPKLPGKRSPFRYGPAPDSAGAGQSYLVGGLTAGVTYTFALVALDEAWNRSPPSNLVSGRVPELFGPARRYPCGHWPRRVLVADFDGDGDQDLAVVHCGPPDNLSFLSNDGDGEFHDHGSVSLGDLGTLAACLDLEGDGDLDVAVLRQGGGRLYTAENDGAGRFDLGKSHVVGWGAVALAGGDVTGDSRGRSGHRLQTWGAVLAGRGRHRHLEPAGRWRVRSTAPPCPVNEAPAGSAWRISMVIDATRSSLPPRTRGGLPFSIAARTRPSRRSRSPGFCSPPAGWRQEISIRTASWTWWPAGGTTAAAWPPWWGGGDGTFAIGPERSLPFSGRLVIDDLDRDGWGDVACLSSQGVAVMFGDGAGDFPGCAIHAEIEAEGRRRRPWPISTATRRPTSSCPCPPRAW